MEAEVRPLKMTEKLTDLVTKYWQDVWERKREGGLVAWCSGGSPHELLRAMDISVVYPESYAAFCSSAGISTDLCQRAEAVGYSPDLCSVVRNFIGLTCGVPAPNPEMLPFGGMPKPDLLVWQPYCPGISKTWEKWSRMFNVPLLIVERPRLHDALSGEEIGHLLKNATEELRGMMRFLERFTGRRFDEDRLGRMLTLEREASGLWFDALRMCQNKPAPMSAFDAFSHVYVFYLYRGTSEAITYYRELNSELAERVAKKIGPLVGEEKYRLYWDNLPIFFKINELTQKFASYGAVPVVSVFPYYVGFFPDLDLGKPMEGIAELLLTNPANRGLKGRVEFITKLVRDHSLDGLVMQRSRTCLVVNMGQDDILKALTEKTGLPAVVVEGDICDARFFSDTEFNSKIDALMEILAQRRRS